jgi:hypothetical protein
MTFRLALSFAAALFALGVTTAAQRAGAFDAPRDHPAIQYTNGPVSNAVSELIANIQSGKVRLAYEEAGGGYLRSLLEALNIPVESQVLVYSETSFQARKINKQNPRAVYFNDRVAVGWVRGGDVLEIAAQDFRQGTIFYELPQKPEQVSITRNDGCLQCHLSWDTLGVPGPMVLTVLPRKSDDEYANGGAVNHSSPFADRWGGWYVTGEKVPAGQMGNVDLLQPHMPPSGPRPVPAHTSVKGQFNLDGYLTPYSDVVALLVLEHQAHATNLITRAGWEYRIAKPSGAGLPPRVDEAVDDLVDYFLFVDEAPLPSPVRGSSGFAEKFTALGPRDGQGRSLRDFELNTRLFRYRLSYMIDSPGFHGLPEPVKTAVWARIGAVLSGKDQRPKYSHLPPAERRAIAEILRATAPESVRHFL